MILSVQEIGLRQSTRRAPIHGPDPPSATGPHAPLKAENSQLSNRIIRGCFGLLVDTVNSSLP